MKTAPSQGLPASHSPAQSSASPASLEESSERPDFAEPTNAKIFYQCVRCGNCCRWPGWVRVSAEEIDRIADFLGLEPRAFIEKYTRLRPAREGLALAEQPDGSCVFLQGRNICTIQPVKPGQCAGFPNAWRFPGWREQCESIEVPLPNSASSPAAPVPILGDAG